MNPIYERLALLLGSTVLLNRFWWNLHSLIIFQHFSIISHHFMLLSFRAKRESSNQPDYERLAFIKNKIKSDNRIEYENNLECLFDTNHHSFGGNFIIWVHSKRILASVICWKTTSIILRSVLCVPVCATNI